MLIIFYSIIDDPLTIEHPRNIFWSEELKNNLLNMGSQVRKDFPRLKKFAFPIKQKFLTVLYPIIQQRWANKLCLKVRKNRKSANFWDLSVIANPQFSQVCQSANRNFANFYKKLHYFVFLNRPKSRLYKRYILFRTLLNQNIICYICKEK